MKLFANPGWGSALIEAQLTWYGLKFEIEDVGDLFRSAAAREKVKAANAIHQVPTLMLDDGAVMTESAAITLNLADLTKSAELVPSAAEPERARFLRWLVFLVANVYPTFTYADDPSRFVEVEAAQKPFRDAVRSYRKRLWSMVESEAVAPWFLGDRFSAIDIYVAVMTHWRPRRVWFERKAPKLAAIARRADELEKLGPVWGRNFPSPAAAGG